MGLTREEAAGEVNESSLSESDKIELIALLTDLEEKGNPIPNALSLAKSGQAVGRLKLKLAQSKGPGIGRGPYNAPLRYRDEELEELWKDLAACKEENGFISLPKKLDRLFPRVKGKLMVRDCYSKLAHIVEERAEVQLLDSTQTGDSEMTDVTSPSAGTHVEKGYVDRSMMVIGTPGIGKSMWLIYLLILLAKADRCVVLDKVQNKDEQGNDKYLFSKSGCFKSWNVHTFNEELGERSTFLLNDSKVPATKVAMTILVSWPAKKIVFRQEEISEDFYMPVWTWEELEKLWKECYSQTSAEDVLFLYNRWGGVVRWVLKHANEPKYLDKLDKAVESMNTEELKKACRGHSDDRVGSRIVHIIPSDDFKRTLETRLATPYISDKVHDKLTRDTVDDVRGFLASTRGDHACSAMRGQLFESFVMSRQSEGQGRTFRVKLPQGFSEEGGHSLVTFQPASKSSFMKLEEIAVDPADANKIWWPLDKTFRSVDFIRQPNEVCQVTLNPKHKNLDLNRIMECFERVSHFEQQESPLIFSYIVASEIFEGQRGIPGIEFPEKLQPSRACKSGTLQAKFKAHLHRIHWRIMSVPYQ